MSVVEPNVLEMLPRTEDRYTMVIAASKRARQIVAEVEMGVELTSGKKPLQTAIEEINSGLLSFERPVEEEESEAE